MSKSKIQNRKSKIFLGVDGGQSHTEAVFADEFGNILGRGFGGASNHAEQPGGRERLKNAVLKSVSEALKIPLSESSISQSFASAHFGMTGGADFKEEIIGNIIKAEHLKVGHDAPTALFGATSGSGGIIVISGTGSAVYGENQQGKTARAGGLGFLFSDEGSGFWLATQAIRLAIKEQDGVIENAGLEKLIKDYFKVEKIRDLTTAFYNEKVSRDEIAGFAETLQNEALKGNTILIEQIKYGAECLVGNVQAVAEQLFPDASFEVAGVGGMFRGQLLREFFAEFLLSKLPNAELVEPRFNPAIGALLLAYREFGVKIDAQLLKNLENSNIK